MPLPSLDRSHALLFSRSVIERRLFHCAQLFLIPTFASRDPAEEDRFHAYQRRYSPFRIQPVFVEWEDRERRDTEIHEFYWMAKSKYKNPFQDSFHHHRDLFANMMLWEEAFPNGIFRKDSRLVDINSGVLSVH